MKPFPKHGMVPLYRQMVRIEAVRSHPVLEWLYTVHTRADDRALTIHHNVSQEDLINAIKEHAQFTVGQEILMGPHGMRRIVARKWNFEQGTTYYRVGVTGKTVASGWFPEARMIDFTKWFETRDREPEDGPEEYVDVDDPTERGL